MFNPKIYNKIKSKIQLSKDGTDLKVTFKCYDQLTGEELPPTVESLVISELEAEKVILQSQIDSIDNLIKDLEKL